MFGVIGVLGWRYRGQVSGIFKNLYRGVSAALVKLELNAVKSASENKNTPMPIGIGVR